MPGENGSGTSASSIGSREQSGDRAGRLPAVVVVNGRYASLCDGLRVARRLDTDHHGLDLAPVRGRSGMSGRVPRRRDKRLRPGQVTSTNRDEPRSCLRFAPIWGASVKSRTTGERGSLSALA